MTLLLEVNDHIASTNVINAVKSKCLKWNITLWKSWHRQLFRSLVFNLERIQKHFMNTSMFFGLQTVIKLEKLNFTVYETLATLVDRRKLVTNQDWSLQILSQIPRLMLV